MTYSDPLRRAIPQNAGINARGLAESQVLYDTSVLHQNLAGNRVRAAVVGRILLAPSTWRRPQYGLQGGAGCRNFTSALIRSLDRIAAEIAVANRLRLTISLDLLAAVGRLHGRSSFLAV